MTPYISLRVFIWGFIRDGERLFTRACGDRTRANGFKLKEGMFRLDAKKNSFTTRVLSPAFVREVRLDDL